MYCVWCADQFTFPLGFAFMASTASCPPPSEDGKDAGGTGTTTAAAGAAQQRMSDYVLPACDSKALCAYLGLFR